MIKYNYKVNSNSNETVNNAQKQQTNKKDVVCKCKVRKERYGESEKERPWRA